MSSNSTESIRESIKISCCYLKKLKQIEHAQVKFKFGLRLQRDEHTTELFAETQEQFNRWYLLSKYIKQEGMTYFGG